MRRFVLAAALVAGCAAPAPEPVAPPSSVSASGEGWSATVSDGSMRVVTARGARSLPVDGGVRPEGYLFIGNDVSLTLARGQCGDGAYVATLDLHGRMLRGCATAQ